MSTAKKHDQQDLFTTIESLDRQKVGHQAIEKAVVDQFMVRKALMVADSSGFSRRSLSHGISHFLTLITRMRQMVMPILQAAHGEDIRFEADNVYAAFDRVEDAVDASIEVHRVLNEYNESVAEEEKYYLCIGLGYGDVLYAGHEGFYGNEMNIASKLGEDTAAPQEILLSEAVYSKLTEGKELFEAKQTTQGGVDIPYYVRAITS
jgi:class 3 adenylate cyclase